MRRCTAKAATLLVACVTTSLGFTGPERAASSEDATTAVGDGSLSYGHDGNGRAYLRFNVRAGETPTGSLLFAGEGHDEKFPHVVVQMGRIDEATFAAHSVKFSGPGQLHDDPVTVTVRAEDKGKVRSQADRFFIRCTDPAGRTVLEADGELFRGDIRIGDD